MTTLSEPNYAPGSPVYELAERNKRLLEIIYKELSLHVDELGHQLNTLSPKSSMLFNSTEHADVTRQIAKSGMSLMRICAALDIDFTAAVENWIIEQESVLFRQQDLKL